MKMWMVNKPQVKNPLCIRYKRIFLNEIDDLIVRFLVVTNIGFSTEKVIKLALIFYKHCEVC